jgi:hypothetical protein
MLGIPEGVNPPRLYKSFHKFRALVSLMNISNSKRFLPDTPCIVAKQKQDGGKRLFCKCFGRTSQETSQAIPSHPKQA